MSQVSPPPRRTQRMAEALRFARSLVVGTWGTALDFGALTLSLRVLHLNATWARVVGLCVGAVVLFYGSRSFAFRAKSESAMRQAQRFAISEAIGFPLNIVAFKAFLWAAPSIAPELLSLAANFVLFLTYYYPVRSYIVFKTKEPLVVPAVPTALTAVPAPGLAPEARVT